MEPIRGLLPLKDELERRLAEIRERQAVEGIAPSADIERLCPTCKYPFSELTHGWILERDPEGATLTYPGGLITVPVSNFGAHTGWKSKAIPCPTCSGDAESRAVAHKQAELVARLFGGSHIPFQMRSWTFKTFPADPEKQKAKDAVYAFAARCLSGDETGKRGLFLGGPVSRGKTGLAVAALKMVMEQGQIGLFIMAIDLLKKIRSTYGKNMDLSEDELLAAVISVPWLVLDDLAVERPTEYVLEQLYYIISKRLHNGLYTIITSNLSTTDLEEYWRPKELKKGDFHMGVRITERLLEMCEGVTVQGRNLRAERVTTRKANELEQEKEHYVK